MIAEWALLGIAGIGLFTVWTGVGLLLGLEVFAGGKRDSMTAARWASVVACTCLGFAVLPFAVPYMLIHDWKLYQERKR